MGPKKKCDFFNGGRGVDFRADPSLYESDSNNAGDSEASCPHSDLSSPESLLYSSSPPSLSPDAYTPPLRLSPTSNSYSGHVWSDYGILDEAIDLSGAHRLPSRKSTHVSHFPLAKSGEPSRAKRRLEPEEDASKRKRQQRCRICANHGLAVDVKGHKWHCPYRNCPCRDCDITRKRQYYMKEQQKITRHQLSKQGADADDAHLMQGKESESNCTSLRKTNPLNYPRLEELDRETADIIDCDLFERINQICRPRVNH